MTKALYLKVFMEHFKLTRRVTTNKSKITHKNLNLQHFKHFRYDLNEFFRLIHLHQLQIKIFYKQVFKFGFQCKINQLCFLANEFKLFSRFTI